MLKIIVAAFLVIFVCDVQAGEKTVGDSKNVSIVSEDNKEVSGKQEFKSATLPNVYFQFLVPSGNTAYIDSNPESAVILMSDSRSAAILQGVISVTKLDKFAIKIDEKNKKVEFLAAPSGKRNLDIVKKQQTVSGISVYFLEAASGNDFFGGGGVGDWKRVVFYKDDSGYMITNSSRHNNYATDGFINRVIETIRF